MLATSLLIILKPEELQMDDKNIRADPKTQKLLI
jgi:hypothetical protein